MSDTLPDFLLARIAEDEETARRAAERFADDGTKPAWSRRHWERRLHAGATASFVIANSPARVLAECEAKRALLIEHAVYEGDGLGRCGACADAYVAVPWDGLCDVAQILATVYADHPDYDEGWKP